MMQFIFCDMYTVYACKGVGMKSSAYSPWLLIINLINSFLCKIILQILKPSDFIAFGSLVYLLIIFRLVCLLNSFPWAI